LFVVWFCCPAHDICAGVVGKGSPSCPGKKLQEFVGHTGTTNLKSSVQSFSGWLSRMTTNYRKYVERTTVTLQEFIAHAGTTNLKSSVLLIAQNFKNCVTHACMCS